MFDACHHLHMQLGASHCFFISIHVSGPHVLHFFFLSGSETQTHKFRVRIWVKSKSIFSLQISEPGRQIMRQRYQSTNRLRGQKQKSGQIFSWNIQGRIGRQSNHTGAEFGRKTGITPDFKIKQEVKRTNSETWTKQMLGPNWFWHFSVTFSFFFTVIAYFLAFLWWFWNEQSTRSTCSMANPHLADTVSFEMPSAVWRKIKLQRVEKDCLMLHYD